MWTQLLTDDESLDAGPNDDSTIIDVLVTKTLALMQNDDVSENDDDNCNDENSSSSRGQNLVVSSLQTTNPVLVSSETLRAALNEQEQHLGTVSSEHLALILLAHYVHDRVVLSDDAIDVVLNDYCVKESIDFFYSTLFPNPLADVSFLMWNDGLFTPIMDTLFDRLNNTATADNNASIFQLYLRFNVDRMLEHPRMISGRSSSGGNSSSTGLLGLLLGREVTVTNLLYDDREVPETDIFLSTRGSVTNCVLYLLSDRLALHGITIPKGICRKWKQYVHAMTATGEESNHHHHGNNSTSIAEATVVRRTRRDKVDQEHASSSTRSSSTVVTCHDFPLYTALRLGYTWYPVVDDLVQADPTVLDSVDMYEVLPPFALAATIDRHENSLHPHPTSHDRNSGGLLDSLLESLLHFEASPIIDATQDNNPRRRCCSTCGCPLFHFEVGTVESGISALDTLSDHVVDMLVTDILSGLVDDPQKEQKKHIPWLDTIYNLLRANPAMLGKVTQIGRTELVKLSLEERQTPCR